MIAIIIITIIMMMFWNDRTEIYSEGLNNSLSIKIQVGPSQPWIVGILRGTLSQRNQRLLGF